MSREGDGPAPPPEAALPRPAWLALAATALAVIVGRRPDFFFAAQLYAEEGSDHLARAINDPLTVFAPLNGTLHWIHALVALAARPLPLEQVPLFFHLVAALVQLAPPLYLISSAGRTLVADRRVRCALALLWLAFPASHEIHATLTNIHWHLAALAVLITLAPAPRSRRVLAARALVVTLSGLSGGHALTLLPVVGLRWWIRRERWLALLLGLTLAAAAAQLLAVALSPARLRPPLGVSIPGALHSLGVQVFAAPLLGLPRSLEAWRAGWLAPGWLSAGLGLAGCVFVAATAIRERSPERRLWLLFGVAIALGGLASPHVSGRGTAWQILGMPGAGSRYFTFAAMGFASALLMGLTAARSHATRAPHALALGLLLVLGVPGDWRHPPAADAGWSQQCRVWSRRPPGTRQRFRITPPGWTMTLEKR